MPPFQPRTAQEAAQQWLARVIARTKLTDAAQGSVISGIAGANGDEIEAMEAAIDRLKRAHWLDASGDLLDERVGDMPPGFQGRLGASAATSDSLTLTIADSAAPTTIPAGTVYGRSDNSGVQYVQVADVTAAAHQLSYPGGGDPPVRVVATVLGTSGNAAAAGLVDLVMTPVNGLVGVNNTSTVGGGLDRESDEQLRIRARAYVQGLTGATNGALLYLALTYQSTTGVRMRHATVWEDPKRPAYAEMLIDDGTGLGGYVRSGQPTGGTVSVDGMTVLYHEAPAVEHLGQAQFTIGAGPAPLDASGAEQWVSVEERGVLYPDVGLLAPGDTWALDDYDVYTGPIAELQGVVEGDLERWWEAFGRRPSGGRVKVRPPDTVALDLAAVIVVRTGADLIVTRDLVIAEYGAYLADIAPGLPFRISILYQRVLDNVTDVANWLISNPSSDKYPPDGRTRFTPGTVTIT